MNTVLVTRTLPTGQIILIAQGDITTEKVDAIVNAANDHLEHGGGVARVIAKKGGEAIEKESVAWIRKHGPVSHTHPAWTSGGDLPAKYVIHAVGPIWFNGSDDEDLKLEQAVSGSLRAADELKCESIAFPAISTGIFGFPKDRAAGIMLSAIETYFENRESNIAVVKLILFDQATVDVFLNTWKTRWGK
jgi:O-acetyl-ADP-ribose deacetylase (regulator of RNase III)